MGSLTARATARRAAARSNYSFRLLFRSMRGHRPNHALERAALLRVTPSFILCVHSMLMQPCHGGYDRVWRILLVGTLRNCLSDERGIRIKSPRADLEATKWS